MNEGIDQGMVFLICFMFLVVMPFVIYTGYVWLVKLLSEDSENEPHKKTCIDAFAFIFCMSCPKRLTDEVEEI